MPQHFCDVTVTFLSSVNGLSPGQCQAIIWTNAGILLIWLFCLSAKWQLSCLGLNVLIADTSLMEDEDPCTLQSQYHGCWWPGDTRNLVIKKHVIFLALLEYPGFITRSIDNIWKDDCWLIKSWKNIRWQVQVHFLQRKLFNFNPNLLKACFKGFN